MSLKRDGLAGMENIQNNTNDRQAQQIPTGDQFVNKDNEVPVSTSTSVANNKVANLYLLAGFANIFGVLAANGMYSDSHVLATMSPSVLSVESQILIQVWGLAYIAVAKTWNHVPTLSAIFFIEKMLYFWWWVLWIREDAHRDVAIALAQSGSPAKVLTGVFFLVYGLNDLCFGLVFLYGAIRGLQGRDHHHHPDDDRRVSVNRKLE